MEITAILDFMVHKTLKDEETYIFFTNIVFKMSTTVKTICGKSDQCFPLNIKSQKGHYPKYINISQLDHVYFCINGF